MGSIHEITLRALASGIYDIITNGIINSMGRKLQIGFTSFSALWLMG